MGVEGGGGEVEVLLLGVQQEGEGVGPVGQGEGGGGELEGGQPGGMFANCGRARHNGARMCKAMGRACAKQ